MESILTIIIALIVALLVIGGAAAFAVMNMDVDDSSQFGHVINKIKEKVTGGSSSEGSESSGGSVVEKVGNVVSEKMVESGQEPGLTYREVTYDDGNIRQYDKDTGELIGSTFDSDQSKLPSME